MYMCTGSQRIHHCGDLFDTFKITHKGQLLILFHSREHTKKNLTNNIYNN